MSSKRLFQVAIGLALAVLLLWLWSGNDATEVRLELTTQEALVESEAESPNEIQVPLIERREAQDTRHLSSNQAWGSQRREPGVRVRVFAHDGTPAADAPVAVLAVRKYEIRQIGWTQFTDSEGRAFLEMTCPSQDERANRYRIAVATPLAEPCETVITAENFFDEHVLTLPPTGQVEVLLTDEARLPYRDWTPVGLRSKAPNGEPPEDMGDFDPGWASDFSAPIMHASAGRALFPWIGLGLELDLGMERPGSEDFLVQSGKGPLRAGETVQFRFEDLPVLALLEIPVLDPLGAPLSRELVSVDSSGLARGSGGGVQTDENGILTLVANPGLRESRAYWLFAREFTGSAPWGAEWKMPVCVAGTRTRLPAIQLQEVPVLAAGVVLHADGRKEPDAVISVYVTSARSFSHEMMINVPLTYEAEFIIFGFVSDHSFSLGARSGWRSGFVELRPGAVDHRLVLPADSERPAWLEWDDPRFMDLAELRVGGQEAKIEKDMTFLHWGFDGEPEALEVIDRFTGEVLIAVPNVNPRPGSAREDPRLRPLDLRGKIRKVRVVWNPDQSEIPDWSIALDPRLEEYEKFNELDDRAIEFLTAREPLNLWINAVGYRPRLYSNVRGELEVRLERATPIIVRLADPAVLSVASWTGCQLLPQFDSHGIDETFLNVRFDGQGLATAWLPKAGEYLLYLQLAGPRGMNRDEDQWSIEIGVSELKENSREEIVINVSAAVAAEAWQTRGQ